MEFFSTFLISIAAFFGWADPDMRASATAEQPAAATATTTSDSPSDSSTETGQPEEAHSNRDYETMLVAGGCFWCVEADLEKLDGVEEVVSGYGGGETDNPTYETYGAGGHREVAKVTYDPNAISFEDILIVTMKTTDPTDDEGTFADRGDKYSAAFYYETAEERAIIESLIDEVDEFGPYDEPLAIDVEPRPQFWPAEDYHQDYYQGTLSQVQYRYYRNASGRDEFIEKHWGENGRNPSLPWRSESSNNQSANDSAMWHDYQKPTKEELREQMDSLTFRVTQEDGTEPAGSSPLDKNWERGIYVDVLSGEPLFSSRDKFDSGTGWPSFTKPITPEVVTEHEDRKLFMVRTEVRSAIADNHLGHVFNDGPKDSTGLRYCMNGVALRFVPEAEMEAAGYGEYLQYL
jgi:peptide methionine sulfoxide reductase msrA/msrB